MLRVSRAVAPEATVFVDGDGGDDVFLGYPEHRPCGSRRNSRAAMPGSGGARLARPS